MPEGKNHDAEGSHSKRWSKTSICEIGNYFWDNPIAFLIDFSGVKLISSLSSYLTSFLEKTGIFVQSITYLLNPLRGYSGLEFWKNLFCFFAYFQSLDFQEYKIAQSEVVVTYFVGIFPCLVFSSPQFASSSVDVRTPCTVK